MPIRLTRSVPAVVLLIWSVTAALATGQPPGAASPPARPPITGVAHIAVYVKDLASARAFYRDFLGFAEPYALLNADGSPSMAFFKVNERQYIELFPEREAATDRLHHIAIETDGRRSHAPLPGVEGRQGAGESGDGPHRQRQLHDRRSRRAHRRDRPVQPPGWTVREKGEAPAGGACSSRIMHVGIIVTQFDAVMRFYTDVLGFTETWRGGRDPKVLSWVNLKVPDGDDYVELMLYATPPAPTQRGSAHHLALEVPDMDRSVAALEARKAGAGYTRTVEIRTGVNRKRQANLFDPDGTRTELMEPRTIRRDPDAVLDRATAGVVVDGHAIFTQLACEGGPLILQNHRLATRTPWLLTDSVTSSSPADALAGKRAGVRMASSSGMSQSCAVRRELRMAARSPEDTPTTPGPGRPRAKMPTCPSDTIAGPTLECAETPGVPRPWTPGPSVPSARTPTGPRPTTPAPPWVSNTGSRSVDCS